MFTLTKGNGPFSETHIDLRFPPLLPFDLRFPPLLPFDLRYLGIKSDYRGDLIAIPLFGMLLAIYYH